ncbi:glutathione S-transferase 1-like [Cylas formicarius]|uniref:glutathione S-transferase 1-like n=1 Tax=Cylas formicarius TaxID=197179 RepID=UPI0029587694|nr:glutathione S-transferase 1-like [Cylas formicarius]
MVRESLIRAIKYHGQPRGLTDLQKKFIADVYDFLNKFLDNRVWLAGDSVTIADISLLATTTSLNSVIPVDAAQFPNVVRWLEGAEELPFLKVNKPGLEAFSANAKNILTV